MKNLLNCFKNLLYGALWKLSKDFPADTCSVCYKLMEEFGGNNFDDNNH